MSDTIFHWQGGSLSIILVHALERKRVLRRMNWSRVLVFPYRRDFFFLESFSTQPNTLALLLGKIAEGHLGLERPNYYFSYDILRVPDMARSMLHT